ncbi:MAG: hypothetical protein QOD63_1855 [Actinomycetota bacterium]|nr:hypothetical protein [Actinomycetota bacterium]
MAYVAPPFFITGQVLAAGDLDDMSGDISDLDRRTSPVGAVVATNETTTSTGYANLATAGPAVTVIIGATGKALVSLHSAVANATGSLASYYGFAVSGATTLAASDATAIGFTAPVANGGIRTGTTILLTGLAAGSTTFTAKYRMDPGVGPATFVDRRISVCPLGS